MAGGEAESRPAANIKGPGPPPPVGCWKMFGDNGWLILEAIKQRRASPMRQRNGPQLLLSLVHPTGETGHGCSQWGKQQVCRRFQGVCE